MVKRFLLLLLLCLSLTFPALAHDTLMVDMLSCGETDMQENYLQVSLPLDGPENVTLWVTDENGQLVYQRAYGVCEGYFCSESIYLRLSGQSCTYQVYVQAGETTLPLTVHRGMQRLYDNRACSTGYPLRSLNGSSSWMSVTFLDLRQLTGGSMTVDVHASNAHTLGQVTFSLRDGYLSATLLPDPASDLTLSRASLQVALTAVDVSSLGTKHFHGLSGTLSEGVWVGDAPYAAVFLSLTVSYAPSHLPGSPQVFLPGQEEIYRNMQNYTEQESNG